MNQHPYYKTIEQTYETGIKHVTSRSSTSLAELKIALENLKAIQHSQSHTLSTSLLNHLSLLQDALSAEIEKTRFWIALLTENQDRIHALLNATQLPISAFLAMRNNKHDTLIAVALTNNLQAHACILLKYVATHKFAKALMPFLLNLRTRSTGERTIDIARRLHCTPFLELLSTYLPAYVTSPQSTVVPPGVPKNARKKLKRRVSSPELHETKDSL